MLVHIIGSYGDDAHPHRQQHASSSTSGLESEDANGDHVRVSTDRGRTSTSSSTGGSIASEVRRKSSVYEDSVFESGTASKMLAIGY